MTTHTCILIDDEPIALQILETYIRGIDFLNLKGQFTSSLQAFAYLQANPVDLIIVDINMPELTGLQLIQSLSYKPRVIITTAYREYAYEGFELDVVDFLVKPVSNQRFLKAISKAFNNPQARQENVPEGNQFIFIKQDKLFIKLHHASIAYLESQRDFVEIHTTDKKYFVRERLSEFEELLPANQFLRVHRRYIVALQAINYIKEDEVFLNNATVLPIGRTYRDTLEAKLKIR